LSEIISKLDPSEFLGSDTTRPAVRQAYGGSGTGKTELMKELVRRAEKSPDFDDFFRLIIVDIKHEGYTSFAKPVTDFMGFVKSLDENRITVVHPTIHDASELLDEIIEYLFDTSERIKGFGATLIVEESSTYITPHSVPDSLKRMATQGRSRKLSLILLNQRALNNLWVESQTTAIVLFRLARPDSHLLKKRWGIDPEALDDKLSEKKFSFAHYDLESLQLTFYEPITLTKTNSRSTENKPDGIEQVEKVLHPFSDFFSQSD